MPILEDYHTEHELLVALEQKGMKRSRRCLQGWRNKRVGPPWTRFGATVLYPIDGFLDWLKSQTQQPVRTLRRDRSR
jgi:hypothetical protein